MHTQDRVAFEGGHQPKFVNWRIKLVTEAVSYNPPTIRIVVMLKMGRNWRMVGSFAIELHKLFWAKGYVLEAKEE